MRVKTDIPYKKEVECTCKNCRNVVVIENLGEISSYSQKEDISTIFDYEPEFVRVHHFYCKCPVCNERIYISSDIFSNYEREQILYNNSILGKFVKFIREMFSWW